MTRGCAGRLNLVGSVAAVRSRGDGGTDALSRSESEVWRRGREMGILDLAKVDIGISKRG